MDLHRRSSFTALAVSLALALAGSGRAEEESPAGEDAPTPSVQLLDDGAEPRVLLRYHPTIGTRETLEMVMDLQQEIFSDDAPMPSNEMPPMRMLLDMHVVSLDEDGDIEARFVFRSMELMPKEGQAVEPVVLDAVKKAGDAMTGLELRAIVTDRGVTKQVELVEERAKPAAAQFADQIRQQLGNTSMPLPLEPVGPGARWIVRQPITNQGLSFEQTATYELTKVQGSRFDLHMTLEQAAEDQAMEIAGLPAEAEGRLVKHQGTGSGDGTYDTTRLAPVGVGMKMDATTQVEVRVMGETSRSSVKTHLTLTMKGSVAVPEAMETPK